MDKALMDLLKQKARDTSKKAYAVYSNFPVGAAFCNEKGDIYTGCNVENISFGLTICAERSAIFKSISEGNKSLDTIIIYTPTKTPTPPCGACRQVIAEFNPNAHIISICDSDIELNMNLSELLPNSEIKLSGNQG